MHSSHMDEYYHLIQRMIHTPGTKESERKKAELRQRIQFRAMNKPYLEHQEAKLKRLVSYNVRVHTGLMSVFAQIQNNLSPRTSASCSSRARVDQ